METILETIYSDTFNLVFIGTSMILLLLFIFMAFKLRKLNKNYTALIKKLGKGDNIEEVLRSYLSQVELVSDKIEDLKKYCGRLDQEITTCIQKVGIVRYNAFKDTGSDLSFALALLDDNNNGVVLNGIYSREMSNIYAKQVVKGETVNKSSDEEKKAIISGRDVTLNTVCDIDFEVFFFGKTYVRGSD